MGQTRWSVMAATVVTLAGAIWMPGRGNTAPLLWNWTWTTEEGLSPIGSGSLVTDAESGGSYLVTSMSGTFDGVPIISLIGPGACCGINLNNNLLYPGSPQLDSGGVAFEILGDQVDFFHLGAPMPGYYIADYVGAHYDGDGGTFSASLVTASTLVPEPAAVTVMGVGVAALGAARRRRAGR